MAKKNENPATDSTIVDEAVINDNQTEDVCDNDSALAEADDIPKFSKEQLLKSALYSHRRDTLAALLEDDETYSHAEVDRLIQEFSERKVQ